MTEGPNACHLAAQIPDGPISDILVTASQQAGIQRVLPNQCTAAIVPSLVERHVNDAGLIYAGCTIPDTLQRALELEHRALALPYLLLNPHLPWTDRAVRRAHDVAPSQYSRPIRDFGWETLPALAAARPQLLHCLDRRRLAQDIAGGIGDHRLVNPGDPGPDADVYAAALSDTEVELITVVLTAGTVTSPSPTHDPNNFDPYDRMPTSEELEAHNVRDRCSTYAWDHLQAREPAWHLLVQMMPTWSGNFADLINTTRSLCE